MKPSLARGTGSHDNRSFDEFLKKINKINYCYKY